MLERIACVVIDNALSMKSFALVRSCVGSPFKRVVEHFLHFDESVHRLHLLVDLYSMLECL
jgi:hypothetical protein